MPRKRKWTVLICSCLLAFAGSFFQELPTPLGRRLQGESLACRNGTDEHKNTTKHLEASDHGEEPPPADRCLDLSSVEYNGLTTAFFFATGAVAIFATLAIKQYGQKWLIWTCGLLTLAGVLVFVGGSYLEDNRMAFGALMLGRIIYGLGNGLRVTVCAHRVNELWKESTQMKGLYVLAAALGSAFSFYLNGQVLDAIGMSNAIWISVGLTALATVAALIQGKVDTDQDDEEKEGRSLRRSVKEGFHHFRQNVEPVFWWFTIALFLIHALITTFVVNAPTLLEDGSGYSERQAIWIIGLVYDLSILIPLFGFLVDRVGHRDYWMTLGAILIFSAFAVYLSSSSINSIVMTVIIGLGFAIFSPLCAASNAMVAPEDTEGVAESIQKFFRFVGAGFFALVAGLILDNDAVDEKKAFEYLMIMLLCMGVVGTLACVMMIWANRRSEERALSRTAKEHKQKIKEEETKEEETKEEETEAGRRTWDPLMPNLHPT
ncbi:hypothetical protein RvY_13799 [Ramazzottius varieornatus]|uniref:Lysosomal dipeptide transporter MFSD1 n=1 Tax=Ramazzottius varieornatus TaxID=947166 RepID=A0A1D1VP60_RAMVA|nr:hypothetical protein RvY_13799 [Ramazzottius varieornatus]